MQGPSSCPSQEGGLFRRVRLSVKAGSQSGQDAEVDGLRVQSKVLARTSEWLGCCRDRRGRSAVAILIRTNEFEAMES